MEETDVRAELLIDDRLAKECIYDALRASDMLRRLFDLDNIKDIGAFLDSFCPQSTKITAGHVKVRKF